MIGEQFGNYKALSLLGEGGMGAVYLAEHPGIGRRVAVKVLHREYTTDEQLLGRLLNEARAANAIRHPNIIEILDTGMRPDGTPYLVMELLEGESLAARIRRQGRLPIRDVIEFTYQTASALGAAHKKGIVHRDLKPDNLFVVPDPIETNRERIKVLDFGIAKLQQPQPGDSVKTRTGTLMGTPIYMSPEQCRGTRAVDHRSDIYSLGVIVYEMLLGKPPFVSEGFGDLVNMHLNVPPTPLKPQRLEIPDALDALVVKMLAKNPEERYADMIALQGALRMAGGTLMRGSSPDILDAPTQPRETADEPPRPVEVMPSVVAGGTISQSRDTTFRSGVGEREAAPAPPRGRGKLVGIAVALGVVGVGALLLARASGGDKTTAAPPPVAPAPTPPPVTTPPPPTEPPTPPAPAKVTVRIASVPGGVRVSGTDGAGAGQVLGTTPLSLSRLKGGKLKLRFEKDGYTPVTRDVQLDEDYELEVTLEKQRPHGHASHKSHESEPAKL
jgi:serine/threonine-protein kinase